MSIIANHLEAVKPSAVSVMSARALELARQGKSIVRLTAGEPDFPPPEHVKQAVIEGVAQNKSKYPPVVGLPELREAVCDKLARDNQLKYAPDHVIISSGCKQVLYNAMAATLNPGDEVLLPLPYWMSYPAMVRLNRGVPVVVETKREDGFRIDPLALEAAITPRTRWLLLNSPNNPSGVVYSEKDLSRIAEVMEKHPSIWILSDDIYEFLVYAPHRFVNLLNVAPGLKHRTLVVNGFSKTFSIPGWRVGYGAGPVELIKAMFKIQTQSTSGANILAQLSGVAALKGDQRFIADQLVAYKRRGELVASEINAIEGLTGSMPEGAFYCLVSCAPMIGKKTASGKIIRSDEDWVNYLLEEGVAVIPGSPFGLKHYFRISFAAADDKLLEGCRRIAKACAKLN